MRERTEMIVITGTSSGLGKELAKLFVADGKRVIGLSRKVNNENIEHIQTDLLDEASTASAVKKISADKEPLEALINCAGVYGEEPIEQLSANEIERIYKTNVFAPMLLTSGLMKKIKADGADIVNVASTVGTKAYVDQASYGGSKWALRGFSQNLQLELKNTPCRVVSFCPGGFSSSLVKNFSGQEIADSKNWMSAKDVATCLKQLLELPKNMEVSEILINRKQL